MSRKILNYLQVPLYLLAMKCPHCSGEIDDGEVKAYVGRIGGLKIARLRGPEYFARLQSMRKTKGGGRPRKERTVEEVADEVFVELKKPRV
jgi:formylmethanofuran dehydrogenase subunit B